MFWQVDKQLQYCEKEDIRAATFHEQHLNMLCPKWIKYVTAFHSFIVCTTECSQQVCEEEGVFHKTILPLPWLCQAWINQNQSHSLVFGWEFTSSGIKYAFQAHYGEYKPISHSAILNWLTTPISKVKSLLTA